MTALVTALLTFAPTSADLDGALPVRARARIEVAGVLYPPDDPEGPDDEGVGEGEGSGGEAEGSGGGE